MTRTTIDLEAGLLEELKVMAAREGESMSRTANRLLRRALAAVAPAAAAPVPLRWRTVPGGEPAPGFDPAGREWLDLVDADRGDGG